MYTMVLMMAVAGSGDTAAFGRKSSSANCGCSGSVAYAAPVSYGCTGVSYGGCYGSGMSSGCYGSSMSSGCYGGGASSGKSRGGFLGLGLCGKKSASTGCTGYVAPACCAPVSYGCTGYSTGLSYGGCYGSGLSYAAPVSYGCTGFSSGYGTGCVGSVVGMPYGTTGVMAAPAMAAPAAAMPAAPATPVEAAPTTTAPKPAKKVEAKEDE
jgi:hypothetical protein